MKFEEFWENESGWGGEMLSEGVLAKDAWNAALEEAAEVADHRGQFSSSAFDQLAMDIASEIRSLKEGE